MGRAWLVAGAVALLASGAVAKTPGRAQAKRYTLVISDARGMTQMDYPSEQACRRAIAAIKAQFDTRPKPIDGGGVFIPLGPPQTFCVPR